MSRWRVSARQPRKPSRRVTCSTAVTERCRPHAQPNWTTTRRSGSRHRSRLTVNVSTSPSRGQRTGRASTRWTILAGGGSGRSGAPLDGEPDRVIQGDAAS